MVLFTFTPKREPPAINATGFIGWMPFLLLSQQLHGTEADSLASFFLDAQKHQLSPKEPSLCCLLAV